MSADEVITLVPATILGGRVADFVSDLGLPFGSLVEGILVLVLGFIVLYVLGRVLLLRGVDRLMDEREVDRHLQLVLLKGAHVLVIALSVLIALYASGYTFLLGALLAGLAAGGLSIGFALQGAVRNVVAGLFIYVEKPFRVGDEIEWSGNAGTVEDIRLRVTQVRSYDNKTVVVPNSNLTDGVTVNPVKEGPLRLEMIVPVDLKSDVDEIKQIILEEAANHDRILEDPAPVVNLLEFEESRILLQPRIWVANEDIGARVGIRDEFVTAVKNRFDAEGIEIPYPHRRISSDRAPLLGQDDDPADETGDPGSEAEPSGDAGEDGG